MMAAPAERSETSWTGLSPCCSTILLTVALIENSTAAPTAKPTPTVAERRGLVTPRRYPGPVAPSVGDRLPDQLSDVDHQLDARPTRSRRGPDLSDASTHAVVEMAVAVAVRQVRGEADDLPSSGWLGASVATQLEQDGRGVVRLDDAAQVRAERALRGPALGIVGASETPVDAPV